MEEKKSVGFLVVGGEANAGPPLGPALGPLGVNVMEIVKAINEATKEYSGMRVPVKVLVDVNTKKFSFEVGVPTTSALIVKEAGIQKGSRSPKADYKGNLSVKQLIKIAKARQQQSYGRNLKSVVKEIIGSCISMGIKIEDKDPRIIVEEITEGKWDNVLEDK